MGLKSNVGVGGASLALSEHHLQQKGFLLELGRLDDNWQNFSFSSDFLANFCLWNNVIQQSDQGGLRLVVSESPVTYAAQSWAPVALGKGRGMLR